MLPFHVYLFDFDGTIAATQPAGIAAITRALAEHGVDVPPTRVSLAFGTGVPLEATVAMLAPVLEPAEIEDCSERYRTIYPDIDRDMTALFNGVHETIDSLRDAGGEIVVISNKGRAALEAALARFDLLDMLSAVLAADPGMPLKPDPEAFHQRVRPLFHDVPLSDFVMVGDTTADIAFAAASGIASCWASYGYGDADACRAMKPDFVIQSVQELLPGDDDAP